MKDECPRCRLDLEPEQGYYVGAMTIAILAAEALTVFLLVLAVIVTWPELPVMPLIIIGVGANIIFPILFYPISKTLWLAIDLAFLHRMDSRDGPQR